MAAIQTTQVTSAASVGAASAVAADLEAIFGGAQPGFTASGEAQGQGAEGHNAFANQLAAALSTHSAQAADQPSQQFNLQNSESDLQENMPQGQNLPFDPSFKSAIEASFAALVQLIQSNPNVETATPTDSGGTDSQAMLELASQGLVAGQASLDEAQAAALLAQSQLAMATQALQTAQATQAKIDAVSAALNTSQLPELKLQAQANQVQPSQQNLEIMSGKPVQVVDEAASAMPAQQAALTPDMMADQAVLNQAQSNQVQAEQQRLNAAQIAATQAKPVEGQAKQSVANQQAVVEENMSQAQQTQVDQPLPTADKTGEAMLVAQRSLAEQSVQKQPNTASAPNLNQAAEMKTLANGSQLLAAQMLQAEEAAVQTPEQSVQAQASALAQTIAQARSAPAAATTVTAEASALAEATDMLPQSVKPVGNSSAASNFSADSQSSSQAGIKAEMLIAAAERAAESNQANAAKLSADSPATAQQGVATSSNSASSTSVNMAAQATQSSPSANEVSTSRNLNQAEILSRAEARLEASRASLGSGPLNVEILRMTRQGGGRAVLEVTPPNQGPIRLDLQLDGAGKALLVIDGLTDSMRARLESTAGFLRQDMASLGLALNLEMREGNSQSSSSAWAQGFGQQSGQNSVAGLSGSRAGASEDAVVSEAVKPAASGSIEDTQSVNLYA